MLKDRDYDVTPHIIAHMYLQMRGGVGEGVGGVVWIWSAKSARCTGRRRVGGGPWVGAR